MTSHETIIRQAVLGDVPAIFDMINHYASERVLLPRSLTDLYESVREFTVAETAERAVIGCGALKFYNQELAEIRSLCVSPRCQGRGVGRLLMEGLLAEAERYNLKTLFAMTSTPEFFGRCGFREAKRERFPMKVWRDCLRCDRYFRCSEATVCLDLSSPAIEAAPEEAAAVTA
jgi:amino-acid N-acetyltransferase